MIAHMVDEVCKEVGTRRLPPGAKRGGKREDSSKPSTYSSICNFLGSLQEEFPRVEYHSRWRNIKLVERI